MAASLSSSPCAMMLVRNVTLHYGRGVRFIYSSKLSMLCIQMIICWFDKRKEGTPGWLVHRIVWLTFMETDFLSRMNRKLKYNKYPKKDAVSIWFISGFICTWAVYFVSISLSKPHMLVGWIVLKAQHWLSESNRAIIIKVLSENV